MYSESLVSRWWASTSWTYTSVQKVANAFGLIATRDPLELRRPSANLLTFIILPPTAAAMAAVEKVSSTYRTYHKLNGTLRVKQ